MAASAETLRVLQSLETELHRVEARQNASRMEELLHPDFEEFGRSGKTWSRSEIIAEFSDTSDFPSVEAQDFKASAIAEGVVLLTYISAHRSDDGQLYRRTLRTSLWVYSAGGWQLRFHQGTPAGAEGAVES